MSFRGATFSCAAVLAALVAGGCAAEHSSGVDSEGDGSVSDAESMHADASTGESGSESDGAGEASPEEETGAEASGADTGASDATREGAAPDAGAETLGSGSITSPALGPAPSEAAHVGGSPFVLVKNWDFGTSGTIHDVSTLTSEFQFHDQFGTIANGTNYGAVIVAPNSATAISASNLGLPNNMQPVEDPTRPNREFTADTLKAYVRPLTTTQTTCTATSHDAGNGSFVAKWTLANGGALLGKDLLWETRVRMPTPVAAYWFALWTAGNQWNKGAEMDTLESFGSSNVYPPPTAFHVNSVGGTDTIDYSSWPTGLTTAGVPTTDRDLTSWHTWTWVYKKDDSYTVYFDGYVVQTGSIHWTYGATSTGQAINMSFLFDFSWGHTQVQSVNISLPASSFPIVYEIDYSRVYLR